MWNVLILYNIDNSPFIKLKEKLVEFMSFGTIDIDNRKFFFSTKEFHFSFEFVCVLFSHTECFLILLRKKKYILKLINNLKQIIMSLNKS